MRVKILLLSQPNKMVKTPHYPKYSTLITLMKILDGVPVDQFKSMWNYIWNLRGTPQNTVNWTDPDLWIEQRLSGAEKQMALRIWLDSNKTVNPRWTRGDQYLFNGYELLVDINGLYQISEQGKLFVSSEDNETARKIDNEEGLIQLLIQASAVGKGKRGDFIQDWRNYLESHSNVHEESVIKDYLRRRLINLWDRGYLEREGNNYAIADKGSKYLDGINKGATNTLTSKFLAISREIESFKKEQRKKLRDYLEKLTPTQFEQLIKELLIEMGYEDVVVTQPTNDKGVDVTAVSQQGITTVKEVIQAKRFVKINVTREVLDKLRGSLHRFDAFQGTIITLSDFAKGAKDAAYEKGAAPITLINGEKLIDLLIENNLRVSKKNFEYFVVEESLFKKEQDEEIE